MKTIFVQVKFSESTEYGDFNDALYYTQDEYKVLSENEINTKIAERKTTHVDKIRNTLPPVELTREELQKLKEELLVYQVDLIRQIDEITEKLKVIPVII